MRKLEDLPYLEWTTDAGEVKRLYADAWKSEEITLSAVATQQKVESGATVSDHYKPEPRALRGELVFGDAPIRGDLDEDNFGNDRSEPLRYAEGVNTSGLPSSFSTLAFDSPPRERWKRALELIDQWQASGTLITIKGSMARLENFAIEDARGFRDSASGGGCTITIQGHRVDFAQSDVAVAVPLPLEPRAQQKKGDKSGNPSDANSADQASAAKKLAIDMGIGRKGSGI